MLGRAEQHEIPKRIRRSGAWFELGNDRQLSGFAALVNLLVVWNRSPNSSAPSTRNTACSTTESAGVLVLVVVRYAVKKESEIIFGECIEFLLFFSSPEPCSLDLSQLFL